MNLQELLERIAETELGYSESIRNKVTAEVLDKLEMEAEAINTIVNAYGESGTAEATGLLADLRNNVNKGSFDMDKASVNKTLSILKALASSTSDSNRKALLMRAISMLIRLKSVHEVTSHYGRPVKEILDIIERGSDISAEADLDRVVYDAALQTISVKYSDSVLIELEKVVGTSVRNLITSSLQLSSDAVGKILDSIDLTMVTSSPSYQDDVFTTLDVMFQKGVLRQIKRRKKVTTKRRSKARVDRAALKSLIDAKTRLGRIKSGTVFNLVTLKNLINLNMHDDVKENMGMPHEPPVRLRYQTGRFASSVQVKAIAMTRADSIRIYYSYMRNPYDVFLPGGRLHNPRRNPRTIIERSIRSRVAELMGGDIKIRNTLV